ncbi:aldehyde dehydrogenase family protein [Verticiella sediminum]|uniref:Aldehyde dehydrogenase family protein n=1 Tax=Verticiella sediminum TaxID=1247510 RepID=A0A556AZF4_9BURK|nr:aldehyde dehydrogenase family protein [Verticiella sediminum]TSH98321.1 aldehyde dehydrogenase family protein [Verticiella sediminum]
MSHSATHTIPVRNPRTGQYDYEIVPPAPDELSSLCAGLRAAQAHWEDIGPQARAAVMLRWADALQERGDALIAAESADTGRFRLSREIVDITIAGVRDWARRAPALLAGAARSGQSSIWPNVSFESQLRPYTLVGAISPWNHPLFLSTVDAIPALLAGCAVIVKCSEIAPRFSDPVMDAVRAVPELAQVFALIQGGAQTGSQLIEEVDMLCFTGSVPTGRKIAEHCARRFIPVFLELGGKDAAIVTASADLERACQAVLRGGVFATGQICHAIERVYVQRDIYEPFVERLAEAASRLTLSYPDASRGHIGPFIMERQAAIVDQQIDDALARGARILTGGKSERHGGGVYMRPTVMVDVTHDMAIMVEETFGPVIPVMPYDDEEDAVRMANLSHFGLSGAVIAGSQEEARRIGMRLDAGGISLQDTTLTMAITRDAEKSSFRLSGMGESRMGPSAIMRYFRRKVLMTNTTQPAEMLSIHEDPPAH